MQDENRVVIKDEQTTGVLQDEIRVLIEDEPDDLIYDSGTEEASDSFQRSPDHSRVESVNKVINSNTFCQDETKTSVGKSLDRANNGGVTKFQAVEPLYHVLEGFPGDCSGTIQEETGNEKPKTENFYQTLMPNYQSEPEEINFARNANCGHDLKIIPSSIGLYQPLTPPNHEVLNDEHNVNSESDVHGEAEGEKKATETCIGIYQLLLHKNQSHLHLHIDRLRSVTGIYQPLRSSRESVAPIVRCSSAPQGSLSQITPRSRISVNGEDDTEPFYQTVADEQRCPLNLDDPSGSFPRAERSSPRASPLMQRRTIHEPTYEAVHVRASTHNRRTCHSEDEPRYSLSPCWHNPATLQLPVFNFRRGHRRNLSDGSRALPAMVNSSSTGSSRPPFGSRPPSALPRHLGHRRNRSDIGLCPIDRSQEHLSRRLTSTSDGGIPRTPSLGSLVTQYPRSASDTTHCRVHIGP